MVVPAVLVAADAIRACEVFEQVAADSVGSPMALIYLAHDAPGEAERQRLRAIEGASYLGTDASPRVLRNAIHAATSTDVRESAEIIDLGLVLKQQRQTLRILVAEDNATNQAIVTHLLESAGHTVILASDGDEALDIYEAQQPDLAILDFNMPERSGVEVTTAIRIIEPDGSRLPIMILSASVTPETRDNVINAGADEFVGKPFDAVKLLHTVDRLARRSSRDKKTRGADTGSVSHAAIPLVDRARMLEIQKISSDSTFLQRLIAGFCSDVGEMLNRLDSSIAEGAVSASVPAGVSRVTDITHALTGASLGIGAAQLASRCREIDRVAENGDVARIQSLAKELRKCFQATAAQLSNSSPGQHRATH